MTLPVPELDTLRFQRDLVDQAKRLIQHYCPEWTDHNVSDPGITLIELFAWMTEMLLYRVAQVPDAMYLRFLDMVGVRLEEPRAARGPVSFYLSAPQPMELTIRADTEVSTLRTETTAPLIFSTEQDMVIRPPRLLAAFTAAAGGRAVRHNLEQLGVSIPRIAIFPPSLSSGDAFYLAFSTDHSHHILALVAQSEEAGGAGTRLGDPPIEWQAFQDGPRPWVACERELDTTGGFNQSGEVILHVPAMMPTELYGLRAYWLRCRLTDAQGGPQNSYQSSPEIERLRVEARGATVAARHATTVTNELVGRSNGEPGQRFGLRHRPLLSRDPERDWLVVEPPGGEPQRWQEVVDFAESQPVDRHYVIDSQTGTLTFGPALLQPNGSVWQFGAVPPRDSLLRLSRYQHGGGVEGNLPVGALSVLKTSIPYVTRVVNRAPTRAGLNAQSVDDARLRAPLQMRSRERAVTADDFEQLAMRIEGVGRACCLAPGAQPASPGDTPPGAVVVLVLPEGAPVEGELPADRALPSAELIAAVQRELTKRCVIGVQLSVREPQLVYVAVQARLHAPASATAAQRMALVRAAETALYRYLSPFGGGPQGEGWPFGRDLHIAETYSLLQRLPGIDFVEDVRLATVNTQGVQTALREPRLAVAPGGLICSYRHRVEVV